MFLPLPVRISRRRRDWEGDRLVSEVAIVMQERRGQRSGTGVLLPGWRDGADKFHPQGWSRFSLHLQCWLLIGRPLHSWLRPTKWTWLELRIARWWLKVLSTGAPQRCHCIPGRDSWVTRMSFQPSTAALPLAFFVRRTLGVVNYGLAPSCYITLFCSN